MRKSIKPSRIEGQVQAPASKSMMQRVTAAALLAEKQQARILNPSFCDDALAALEVAENLGAQVEVEKESVIIRGCLSPARGVLDCGEAGLCLRMFTPIAALCSEELILTGKGGLLRRPVSMIENPLRDLGVKCESRNGYPPIRVTGPMEGGKTEIDGSISSQFLTGLLLALPMTEQDSEITVRNLQSKPYIDMTLKLLQGLGIDISHQNYESFRIKGRQGYTIGEYSVEGDWSSASFLFVAGAVSGEVYVSGLDIDSPQADKHIIEALEAAGAEVDLTGDTVSVKKKNLKLFHFNATDCPDLFPPLVALACHCEGISTLRGVKRLPHKESDRSRALFQEFRKLGISITVTGDEMLIQGGPLQAGTVHSHNDHRIAMAAAAAALAGEGEVLIEDAECVSKSYPRFYEDLTLLGGKIDE